MVRRRPKYSSESGRYFYFLLILSLLLLGGIFITQEGGITGALLTSTSTLSVSINAAPVVTWVQPLPSQSITESSTTAIKFIFNVSDADGFGTIDNGSARVYINFSTEDVRSNSTCLANVSFANTTTFHCIVLVWYFDGAGDWTINASANDTNGVIANNVSSNFTLASTTAMVMSPSALTWPSIELGSTNKTSNADPLTVNNTGNKDIAAGGITVTGSDLQGVSTTTDFIRAKNLTVWHLNGSSSCSGVSCLECNGTIMVNATAEPLAYANISAANNSLNYQNQSSGQENLFFCITTVAAEISRQTYNTAGTQTAAWTVTVS